MSFKCCLCGYACNPKTHAFGCRHPLCDTCYQQTNHCALRMCPACHVLQSVCDDWKKSIDKREASKLTMSWLDEMNESYMSEEADLPFNVVDLTRIHSDMRISSDSSPDVLQQREASPCGST